MDKTPEYQKMCIEAFKDIGYIKPTTSSNLMIPAPDSIQGQQEDSFILSFADEFDNIGLTSTVARPVGQLYQQDQLQGMSGLSWWEFDKRCNDIRRCLLEDPLSETEVETKEQAGICVVMEKYGKIWDDKELKWTHT